MTYQLKNPFNIFGMPTTFGDQYGSAQNLDVPQLPEHLATPKGQLLGGMPPPQQPSKAMNAVSKIGQIANMIGGVANNASRSFWANQGGPRGEAARQNMLMDIEKQKAQADAIQKLMESMKPETTEMKFMHDLFGSPPAGGYTPEQYAEAQRMKKGFSHAPVGSSQMSMNDQMDALKQILGMFGMGDMVNQESKETPNVPGKMNLAGNQGMSVDDDLYGDVIPIE